MERFHKVVMTATHITSGQPVRRPQIVGLRWENTHKGSLRNVFVAKGRVIVRTIGDKMVARKGRESDLEDATARLSTYQTPIHDPKEKQAVDGPGCGQYTCPSSSLPLLSTDPSTDLDW